MPRVVARGEEERELAAFCASEHPRLVRTLALYTGDAQMAEELAQEAVARLCRDWRKVRAARTPSAYAYRVAINVANSHFRHLRTRREKAPRIAADEPAMYHDPDQADAVAVRRAVRRLPRRKRAVLVLRYYRDLSVADTAEALGIPEGTVKTLTHRALADLEGELGGCADDAAPAHAPASHEGGALS